MFFGDPSTLDVQEDVTAGALTALSTGEVPISGMTWVVAPWSMMPVAFHASGHFRLLFAARESDRARTRGISNFLHSRV